MTADVAQLPTANKFEVFKPDENPLLVRGPIGNVFDNNKKSKTASRQSARIRRSAKPLMQDVPPAATLPPESHLNLPSPRFHSPRSRSGSKSSSRFGAYSQASFFSRHNPHPSRVRHIKGLNDQPICAVNDDGYFPPPRFSIATPTTRERERIFNSYLPANVLGLNSSAFPINTITGLQNYPFKEKAIPSIGLVPITESWRDELREFCTKAGIVPEQQAPPPPQPVGLFDPPKRRTIYSAETGRVIPPPSRAMSRASSRGGTPGGYNNFMHITAYPDTETIMLEMLCQILQTDSVYAVQQWLVSSGDREKSLVLDMIKSAMTHEENVLKQQSIEDDAMVTGSRPATSKSLPLPPTPLKTYRPNSRPGTSPMQKPITTEQGAEILKIERTTSRNSRRSTRPLGTPASRASRRALNEEKVSSPTIRYTKTPTSGTRRLSAPLEVIEEVEAEKQE